MVTIITPTGDRTEAFELARKWMFSQTMPIDQWLVVDDGQIPLPKNLREGLEYIRRVPGKDEGHTLTLNMKTALPYIKGDIILIVEDDDWYGPNYVATMVNYLRTYDLVGENYARYYHLSAMKYRRIGNSYHASFCQTGFTNKLLPVFERCLEGDPYIDARLWRAVTDNVFLITDTEDRLQLHCSLKGLKGRKGIGSGHKHNASYYNTDVGLEYLIKWVGEENARIYMNHVGQSFDSARLIGVDRKGYRPLLLPVVKNKGNGITVITCTGDRPESFDLLQIWMGKQTCKPEQWIVIDDGKVPIVPKISFEYYRRHPSINDYPHTLCLNMLEALLRVRGKYVIIMEDDDWYDSTYIDYMCKLLEKADLVGFQNLIFYYPTTGKYMKRGTAKQPALSQTAFRRSIIPVMQEICNMVGKEWKLSGKGLIDDFLWNHSLTIPNLEDCIRLTTSLKVQSGRILDKGTIVHSPFSSSLLKRAERRNGAEFFMVNTAVKATKLIVACDSFLTVGMKGQPGRKGLTTHHQADKQQYRIDIGHNLLKSILKSDADFYIKK